MDTILVVNAGSRASNSRAFGARRDGGPSVDQGPDRRALEPPALARRRGDGSRADRPKSSMKARPSRTSRPRLARRAPGCGDAERSIRSPSAIAWCMAAPTYDRPVRVDRARAGTSWNATFRWRRCISRTTLRRSARFWRVARSCRRLPASTPRFIAATARWQTISPCRWRFYARGRAALWISRPVLRIYRERAAELRAGDRDRPRDRRASRQRRSMCAIEGRPQRRKHAGIHRARRACRWARGRGRSIPASCFI